MNNNKKLIKEELGISQIVVKETDELINLLNECSSDINNYRYFTWDENYDNVYGIQLSGTITLFDNYEVTLFFKLGIFNSKEELQDFYKKAKYPERYYFNSDDNCILISCCAYRENFRYGIDTIQLGIKNTRLRGTLSHELKHAYQFFMKNKTPLLNNNNGPLYLNALKLKEEQTGYPSIIGYILYYLYNIEITANVQDLWTTIIHNADGDYNKALEIFNNSELYKTTKAVPLTIKIFNDNKISQEQIDIIQSYLKLPINKVFSLLNNGNKKLIKACGKIRTMIEKYFNNTTKITNENIIKIDYNQLKQIINETVKKIITDLNI